MFMREKIFSYVTKRLADVYSISGTAIRAAAQKRGCAEEESCRCRRNADGHRRFQFIYEEFKKETRIRGQRKLPQRGRAPGVA